MYIQRVAEVQSFIHFSAEAIEGISKGKVSDNTQASFGIIIYLISALILKLFFFCIELKYPLVVSS